MRDAARAHRSSRLDEFLGRLNWSPERLAREINQLHGTEMVSLKAPYHWLRGSYPRGDMPDIVAGILSAQLTEEINAAQIWLSDRPEGCPDPARPCCLEHGADIPRPGGPVPRSGGDIHGHGGDGHGHSGDGHGHGGDGHGGDGHGGDGHGHRSGVSGQRSGVSGQGADVRGAAGPGPGAWVAGPGDGVPGHSGDVPEHPTLSAVPTSVDAGARMAAVLDWLAGTGGDVTPPVRCRRPMWPDLLRVVESRASQVLDLYEKYGGAAAVDIAAADLASARALAQSVFCDAQQARRLHRAIAQLSETAGLSAAQVGDPTTAHRQLLAGLWAAQVTGDRALGAQLIAALCETLPDSGREALRLISVAMHGARGSDERIGRRLRCRQALAYARLGDVTAFGRIAEGLVVDALADRDDPGDAGLHVAELGLGWLGLDRPVEAARTLEAGLALLGDRHPYKRLHFSSALALALLRVGQGESAGRVVTGIRGLAVHLQADLDGLLPTELREAVGT